MQYGKMYRKIDVTHPCSTSLSVGCRSYRSQERQNVYEKTIKYEKKKFHLCILLKVYFHL